MSTWEQAYPQNRARLDSETNTLRAMATYPRLIEGTRIFTRDPRWRAWLRQATALRILWEPVEHGADHSMSISPSGVALPVKRNPRSRRWMQECWEHHHPNHEFPEAVRVWVRRKTTEDWEDWWYLVPGSMLDQWKS